MFSYFTDFELPVQFYLDEADLRKRFLRRARRLQPDFNAEQAAQDAILLQATQNNKAYETLSDFDKRLHYILSEKELLGNEAKNALPQDFLLDMMDINETLDDLENDYDETIFLNLKQQLETLDKNSYFAANQQLTTNDATLLIEQDWQLLKIFYLKRRYLLRIFEKVHTFAAQ